MADESRSSSSTDSDTESEPETRQITKSADPAGNAFKNDGSFMEMFKKMQDERNKKDAAYLGSSSSSAVSVPKVELSEDSKTTKQESQDSSNQLSKKPSILSLVGKRRGGRVLPTGMVKKAKKGQQQEEEGEKNDAWSRYLDEVRKYREQSCEEEGKRRPLVK